MALSAGTGKRAHKTLTIGQKLELLGQIAKKWYIVLYEKYEIGRSTVTYS